MEKKKIIGAIFIVISAVSFGASSYIQSQIDQGQQKIQKAQKSVDTGNAVLSLSPATKKLGENLSKPIQKKIDAGQGTIDRYQAIVSYMKIAGYTAAFIGLGLLLLSFLKKKSS